MPANDILELKFTGNGIDPAQVKPSEIASLIENFEKVLLLTIKAEHPEIDTSVLLFTFDSIHNESLDLRFSPKDLLRKTVVSAYTLVSTSFQSGEFDRLPSGAIAPLKSIVRFSKTHDCVGQFNLNNETLGSFTPTTDVSTNRAKFFKGDTTVSGKIIDVGGDNPNVHMKINDEYTLIFNTTEQNAKVLATKLYEKVLLKGVAKWDALTLEICDFTLGEIVDYKPGNSYKSITKIKGMTSGYWDQFNTADDINNQLLRD